MLIWIIVGFALGLALIFALRTILLYRIVMRDGAADYKYKTAQGMIKSDVSRADYIAAYRRYYGPRGSAYIALTLVAIAVLTAPMLGILTFLFEFGWRLGGQDRAFEPGYLVWQFMIFGSMIIGWALITWVFARHYYKGAPISFETELAQNA